MERVKYENIFSLELISPEEQDKLFFYTKTQTKYDEFVSAVKNGIASLVSKKDIKLMFGNNPLGITGVNLNYYINSDYYGKDESYDDFTVKRTYKFINYMESQGFYYIIPDATLHLGAWSRIKIDKDGDVAIERGNSYLKLSEFFETIDDEND